MSVLELFCDVDDFMLNFALQWRANQLVLPLMDIPLKKGFYANERGGNKNP